MNRPERSISDGHEKSLSYGHERSISVGYVTSLWVCSVYNRNSYKSVYGQLVLMDHGQSNKTFFFFPNNVTFI